MSNKAVFFFGYLLGIGGFALAVPAGAQSILAGEQLFRQCVACHQIGDGATNAIGPDLTNVVGRQAGDHPGYRFSEALVEAGIAGLVWDEDALDSFLERPQERIPGTKMSYRGLRDADDRATLVAYLASFADERTETAVAREGFQVASEVLALQGDAAYGEYLSGECRSCHNSSDADDGIPSISGRSPVTFVIAMQAYKQGAREHPVMSMIAGRLSNEEIAGLAAYFENVN